MRECLSLYLCLSVLGCVNHPVSALGFEGPPPPHSQMETSQFSLLLFPPKSLHPPHIHIHTHTRTHTRTHTHARTHTHTHTHTLARTHTHTHTHANTHTHTHTHTHTNAG